MDKDIEAGQKVLLTFISVRQHLENVFGLAAHLDEKQEFYPKENLENLGYLFTKLRTALKNARIFIDAYLEIQEVYNEVYNLPGKTTPNETNIPQLIPQMDYEIRKFFSQKSCKKEENVENEEQQV